MINCVNSKKVSVEVLVATMNQENFLLCNGMNIKGSSVIANQTTRFEYVENNEQQNTSRMISTNSKGVGLNRNIALMFSNADICLLSDDDMIYQDDYIEIILEAFDKLPKADIVIFNIVTDGVAARRINKKISRVNVFNFQNYGSIRIAFRRARILQKNIWFSLLFGGGCIYSSGEDTLFLRDALREKLKIYTYPKTIGVVSQHKSSWFTGYNEKFFFDKGALLQVTFPIIKYLLGVFYFPLRFRKNAELSYAKRVRAILAGIKAYKTGNSYEEWHMK